MRRHSTNFYGNSFDEATIQAVWNKAKIVPGINPALRRQDACGAWIDRYQYGITVSNGHGWEIDHIVPVSKGGSDHITNLQPLQWENNRHKGDEMFLKCKVFALV